MPKKRGLFKFIFNSYILYNSEEDRTSEIAESHAAEERNTTKSRMKNLSFNSYLMLLGILTAFFLIIWVNHNLNFPNSLYVELWLGFVVFLILLYHTRTLQENMNLYLDTKKEMDNLKLTEKSLKENQRTFETLISNLPGVVYRCWNDHKWTMEFVSEGCMELTGYHPEDLLMNKNVSYEDLIHHEDREMVRDTIQKALKENEHFKISYRIITSDLKEKYVWEQGKGVFSANGELMRLEGFITDITKRKKAEKALQKSELYYRTIFENTGTATLIFGEDTVVSIANSKFERLSGYKKEEMEGKSWIDLIAEEDVEMIMNYHGLRKINPDSVPQSYETKLINKWGDIRDVYVTVALIPNTKNRLISLLDITERKETEKHLKTSLGEKELFLKEIHHRVKNNLQIISSLLDLQVKYVDHKEAVNVLHGSKNRVKTMAMIHEMLYQADDLASINFSNYIKNLVQDLFYFHGRKNNIKPIIDAEQVFLNIETAIPCGLIINELVSNSLKYAFPDGKSGEVFISLHRHCDWFELIISDNGIGLPSYINFENTQTLGLQLVNMLINQLEGLIELEREKGTMFCLKFKELNYKKRF